MFNIVDIYYCGYLLLWIFNIVDIYYCGYLLLHCGSQPTEWLESIVYIMVFFAKHYFVDWINYVYYDQLYLFSYNSLYFGIIVRRFDLFGVFS